MLAPITRRIVEFIKQEDGATAVEYAVMLALIIVVCFIAVTAIGQNTSSNFNSQIITSALKSSSS